jgi:hypothetical protein
VSVRRILTPLTLTAMAAFCVEAAGQGALPAPLPSQSQSGNAAPAASPPSDSAASQGVFSQGAAPVGGGLAAGASRGGGGGTVEQQVCMEKFVPIRAEAEKRANAIKAASDRKAPPQEACGLIKSYVQAEAELVSYVTAKQIACGIPSEIPKQLKANQARSQQMLKVVCHAAAQPQRGDPAADPLFRRRHQDPPPPDQRPFRVLQLTQTLR